ncbi:MAG: hypothetical protein KY467_09480 [Gemmatimonadetes bacterium]|nr:hypothetical protein [Gemmatimonadota bacterium]
MFRTVPRALLPGFAALALNACSPDGVAGPPDTVLLTQASPTKVVMQALFEGRVDRDEQGCLRLDSQDRHTVVWPFGFTLVRRDGGLYVRDAFRRDIGRIGGPFRFGGGEVPTVEGADLPAGKRELAESRCPGRYWVVGATNLKQ